MTLCEFMHPVLVQYPFVTNRLALLVFQSPCVFFFLELSGEASPVVVYVANYVDFVLC